LIRSSKQALAAWLGVAATCLSAHAAPPTEHEVKAAFIHNIARFVEWPASVATRGTLRLCVLGQGALGEAVTVLQGKRVGSRVWAVRPAPDRADPGACDVLVIEASETGSLPRLLDTLGHQPVLTVGDTEGYGQRGVMINFYLEQSRVRFEINLAAARRAGFRISSQLLKLARIVEPAGEAR
jgi:hypothetical protein